MRIGTVALTGTVFMLLRIGAVSLYINLGWDSNPVAYSIYFAIVDCLFPLSIVLLMKWMHSGQRSNDAEPEPVRTVYSRLLPTR